MNYFKGYKKSKKRVMKGSLSGLAVGYTKDSLAFSLGSQIVSRPEFGAIGMQGAQGLALGASFLPPIATIGVGGYVIKKVKKLGRKY